ncbi:hypothetical protein ABZ897_00855 [Nonomuraea sp. NPDC046802]|uniref:hypothetical protein n=1 Tax=Nonomuraea sp. NPDC046802 TaxID=3154919 RepID=UPI0033DDEC5D
MRVVAEKAFETYFELQIHQISEGQTLKGAMAAHVRAAGAPVRVLDEAGSEQGPPPAVPPAGLDISGTAKEVLAWVGDDPARAAEARDAEAGQDKPRSTLLKALEEIAAKG